MKPHVLFVREGRTHWWFVSDGTHTVRGSPNQTEWAVIAAWERSRGKPADGYVRVPGFCRAAELCNRIHRALSAEGGAA